MVALRVATAGTAVMVALRVARVGTTVTVLPHAATAVTASAATGLTRNAGE
jgi:hypothetical protein